MLYPRSAGVEKTNVHSIEDCLSVGEEMTATPSFNAYLSTSLDGIVLYSNVDALCKRCVSIEKYMYVIIEMTLSEIRFREQDADVSLHLQHNHYHYVQMQCKIAILGVE